MSQKRIGLLTYINNNISRKTYALIDVELIPRFFKDVEQFKDIMTDLYPILKLIVRYNSHKIQNDQSLKSVLSNRLSNISKNISKVSSLCSSPQPHFGESGTYTRVGEIDEEDEVNFEQEKFEEPRIVFVPD